MSNKELSIENLQSLCKNKSIIWSVHILRRLQERGIFRKDVVNAILTGEIIEQYPDDKPYPSCLILGESDKGYPLHVVCSTDGETVKTITAYYPNSEKFLSDNRTRKEKI